MIILIIIGVILLLFLWYVLTPRKKDTEGFKLWSFDENSWHARYFKWVTDSDLPQGGCAYFWAMLCLIVFSEIIFIVHIIYGLIIWIGKYIPERKPKERTPEEWQMKWDRERKREIRNAKIAGMIGKIFLVGIVGLVLFVLIRLLSTKGGPINLLVFIGAVALTVGTCFLMVWLWRKGKVGNRIAKPFLYMGSVISMIYTKSCPKITWNKSIKTNI